MSPSSGNLSVCLLTVYMHLRRWMVTGWSLLHTRQNIRITLQSLLEIHIMSIPRMTLSSVLDAYMQPGSDWRDVLILSGHIGWLLSLYAALRPKFSCEGYWLDCPIAVSARKLIVQFSSLTGTVFLSGITASSSIFMLTVYVYF